MPLTRGVGKGFKDQFPGTDATNKKLKDGTREPNWRREVRKKIETRSKNPKRCVTDFMDHIIAQMKAKFDGTWYEDKWMVYHDALSAWTATDSMEYLKSTGYADRFITIVGTNNDLVCKRYRNSKPGNSPEFSRGCDSFGFPSTSSRWSLTAAWHRSTHSAIPGEFSIKEIPWSSGTSWRRLGQKSHQTQRAWSRISRPFLMSLESCMKMKAASSQIWLSAVAAATCLKNMPGRRGRAT